MARVGNRVQKPLNFLRVLSNPPNGAFQTTQDFACLKGGHVIPSPAPGCGEEVHQVFAFRESQNTHMILVQQVCSPVSLQALNMNILNSRRDVEYGRTINCKHGSEAFCCGIHDKFVTGRRNEGFSHQPFLGR